MSDVLVLRTLLCTAEAVAASIALPGLAWLAVRAQPRNAARRHLIWATALAGLLVLPLLAAVTPSIAVLTLPAAPAIAPADIAVAAPASAPPIWASLGWQALLIAAFAVWAAGVLWFALQALVAAAGLEALRRRGAASPPPKGLMARSPRWELRFSEDCAGPMTWGVLRPVVMLPWAALRWTPERTNAVLRHELAHVRRRDALAQALAAAACALYWPNPLVWRAARNLRREAEVAADDAVLASGVRPSDYASELLELAREWRGQRHVFAGMAMAAPAALTERVQSILSPNAQRTGATAMDSLKLIGIGCAAAATLAVVRPSIAETTTPAPAAPPAVSVKPLTAPAAPAAPAAPTAPAAPVATARPASPAHHAAFRSQDHQIDINGDRTVIDGQVRPLTPEEKASLDRELAQIGPTVHKAIADAHIEERVAQQVAAQNARTQAEVARQMAEIGPRIQKAMADAKIEETVARRMAEIQPRIDAALARAQAASERAQARAEKAREAAEKARSAEQRN